MALRLVPATEELLLKVSETWVAELRADKQHDAEWDWHDEYVKVERDDPLWETYAITDSTGSRLLALMSIDFNGKSRCEHIPPGIPYIEKLAIAPWTREYKRDREVLGLGPSLLRLAIDRSTYRGFRGCLALHSLTTEHTVKFYREKCGMDLRGQDVVDGQVLPCLELSAAAAASYAKRAGEGSKQ